MNEQLIAQYRPLLKLFLLVAALAFGHGQAYVFLTTHGTPPGITEHYNGATTPSDGNAELSAFTGSAPIEPGKPVTEMVGIIHSHLAGMGVLFLATGLIFLGTTRLRGRRRTVLALEPMAALLSTFGGLWLVRYVHPAFSWLVMLSGVVMAVSFYLQIWHAWRGLNRTENALSSAQD